MFKDILSVVLGVVFVFVVIFGLGYASYEMYAFFNPRYAQVQYNTFKNTQAYNEGMLHHLYDIKRQYIEANKDQQQALGALAKQEFETYDISRLPFDLQEFYRSL